MNPGFWSPYWGYKEVLLDAQRAAAILESPFDNKDTERAIQTQRLLKDPELLR